MGCWGWVRKGCVLFICAARVCSLWCGYITTSLKGTNACRRLNMTHISLPQPLLALPLRAKSERSELIWCVMVMTMTPRMLRSVKSLKCKPIISKFITRDKSEAYHCNPNDKRWWVREFIVRRWLGYWGQWLSKLAWELDTYVSTSHWNRQSDDLYIIINNINSSWIWPWWRCGRYRGTRERRIGLNVNIVQVCKTYLTLSIYRHTRRVSPDTFFSFFIYTKKNYLSDRMSLAWAHQKF